MAERLRVLSFVGGEQGYCVLIAGPDGMAAARLGGGEPLRAASIAPLEEGRATLKSDAAGAVELSWTPAGPMLQFEIGAELARVHAIAASAAGAGEPLSGPGVLWDLPAAGHSAIRTVWAATAKGALTVLVAVRPEDSRDHGEEIVGAARVLPKVEPYGYGEPLLSTEYDASGTHTRATLELWPGADEGVPERGGGTRLDGLPLSTGHGRLEAARFAWRIDGAAAIGAYEILTP